MWTTPKTNWQSTDSFMLNPDYERIRGNMQHLHGMAQRLYPAFGLVNMADYTIEGLPFIEFFDNVETNLQRLYDCTFKRRDYANRVMRENGSVWDFRDLNRIEGILGQMYSDMLTQESTKPVLSFKMGGGAFAALI